MTENPDSPIFIVYPRRFAITLAEPIAMCCQGKFDRIAAAPIHLINNRNVQIVPHRKGLQSSFVVMRLVRMPDSIRIFLLFSRSCTIRRFVWEYVLLIV